MPSNPEFIALKNSIVTLNSSIERMIGSNIVGGSKNILSSEGIPAGGKPLNELLAEQNDALKELTKTLSFTSKKQEQSLVEHAKKLEGLGIVMNAVGQGLQQFTKYNVSLPYQLMGGQFGAVAQPALQREKEAGGILTTAASLAALAIPGFGKGVALGISGAGQLGLNQFIGRAFFQDTALQAASRQSMAQITQSGTMGFRESAHYRFGVERFDVAAAAVGGQSLQIAMHELAKVGIIGPQAMEIAVESLKQGGAKGLKEVVWKKVSEATAKGIYGDAAEIAVSTARAGRFGFSQEDLMSATQRTGFFLPTQAQLATSLGTKAYLAPGSAQNLFSMATNMPMARVSTQMAAQFITETAGRTGAVAAGGNEAQEMLLFQQFRLANPEASYLDFIEASRNKEFDERWLEMLRTGAPGFAAGGQIGKIIGSSLGFFGRPAEASVTAAQFAGGKLGDIVKGGKGATLVAGEVSTIEQSNVTNMTIALKFQKQWGTELEHSNEALMKVAKSSENFTKMLYGIEVIMRRLSRSVFGIEMEKRFTTSEEAAIETLPGQQG